ncbi:hypothetical protein F0U61_26695 [Archangium violaceum]|uniref:hypothetical protein n=1 Tax=Archangium violaceum TaxID=83451 RepID=UPI002B2FF010|nr:hypothetical protein F0U61_26695 [Archangium violaceum]
MSRFEILSRGQVIGVSDLETGDPSMGVALGRFHPSPLYETVRPVFMLYRRATDPQAEGRSADEALLTRYYQERDALGLSVRSASGESVGTQWVHIDDYSDDLGMEGLEVSIAVDDSKTHERFFPDRE